MGSTRLRFLKLAALTAPGLAILTHITLVADGSTGRAKPLRTLTLGSAGFTGPHQTRYALARGCKLTSFNRGRQPDKTAAVAPYDGKDAMVETQEILRASNSALYGSLKAVSGREASARFSGSRPSSGRDRSRAIHRCTRFGRMDDPNGRNAHIQGF